jgi:hypothetical protein
MRTLTYTFLVLVFAFCPAGCFLTAQTRAQTMVTHTTTTVATPTFNRELSASVAVPANVQVLQAHCQEGTQEACNGLDDNCNGVIDEGCDYSGGNVQITAAWQTASDVDLHVVDPSGAEIYYGSVTSPSGGRLDHDANAACQARPPTVENVFWSSQSPPRGTYQIRLHAYDMCGVPNTPTTLSISVGGRIVGTYSATFTQQNQMFSIPLSIP